VPQVVQQVEVLRAQPQLLSGAPQRTRAPTDYFPHQQPSLGGPGQLYTPPLPNRHRGIEVLEVGRKIAHPDAGPEVGPPANLDNLPPGGGSKSRGKLGVWIHEGTLS
jgi:hypothetical protein